MGTLTSLRVRNLGYKPGLNELASLLLSLILCCQYHSHLVRPLPRLSFALLFPPALQLLDQHRSDLARSVAQHPGFVES